MSKNEHPANVSNPSPVVPLIAAALCGFLLITAMSGSNVMSYMLRPDSAALQYGPTTGNELADFIETKQPNITSSSTEDLVAFGREVGDSPVVDALRARYAETNTAEVTEVSTDNVE